MEKKTIQIEINGDTFQREEHDNFINYINGDWRENHGHGTVNKITIYKPCEYTWKPAWSFETNINLNEKICNEIFELIDKEKQASGVL
jgi:hypothetical protein